MLDFGGTLDAFVFFDLFDDRLPLFIGDIGVVVDGDGVLILRDRQAELIGVVLIVGKQIDVVCRQGGTRLVIIESERLERLVVSRRVARDDIVAFGELDG